MNKTPSLFRRLFQAAIERRRQQAQRHIDRYLKELGLDDRRQR